MTGYSPAVEMCVRWCARHRDGVADTEACLAYYEAHSDSRGLTGRELGFQRMSRRGAAGRMARRLRDLGLAGDETASWGVLTFAGWSLAEASGEAPR